MVKLREIQERESKQLANLISQDDTLRKELGFQDDHGISPDSIQTDIQSWQKDKSAICFGIFQNRQIVGMISLSHRDAKTKTARIGYWIGSDFRRKGIATEAFAKVITKAQEMGIASLSSRINKTNQASISIWNKFKPNSTEISSDQVRVEIDIKRQPQHEPDAFQRMG